MTTPTAPSAGPRLVAVDVLRGLVLVFLLPDLAGGFSFYRMAELQPGHWAWEPLAAQFRHVDWGGVAAWDLVMPLFVFIVGIAMALSHDRRRDAGASAGAMLGHAAIRSATLFVLGLMLPMKLQSHADEAVLLLVLSTGLPVGTWLARAAGHASRSAAESFGHAYALATLLLAVTWMAAHSAQLGDFEIGTQILALLGIAYLPAFWLQRFSLRTQALAAVAVVAGYGIAFLAYTAPAGLVATGEVYTGLFAHWNNNTNLGAAFDRGLFGWLPRITPYTGQAHGYHTLLCVPLMATILCGAMAGRVLARDGATRAVALRFAAIGLAGMALSGLMGQTLFPLLKSLWTPTWSVFSSSACLLMLAALVWVFGRGRPARWSLPLVVLGTNSMLLYVLAFTERWRIVGLWNRLLGSERLARVPAWPVIEASLVLATLWVLAFVLYRRRIFLRL